MRKSGILMPVFSLPSPYGIGCFSEDAKKFIDKLARAGQSYWQILPLGPTSYGDSPYQSPSAFAGNPYFIDIDTLARDGLVTKEECESYRRTCPQGKTVDYRFLYETRSAILKKAFSRFDASELGYTFFVQSESFWLEDYVKFAAVKEHFGMLPLNEWESGVRLKDKNILEPLLEKLMPDMEFHKFLQYQFMKQWLEIKTYANRAGIEIIGDIPIYTAYDSAESWCYPELFQFDENNDPICVAGCPPDRFGPHGQLWGNPVYNWSNHSKTGYKWWIERLRRSMRLYDVVRIDHFRGFESFYSVPFGDKTAEHGIWQKGPGRELFDALNKGCPELKIIAEDLGFITESVKKLLEDVGYPGMKVLQFAFDSREQNDYLPHNYTKNCVVYTGTHDNHTAAGWLKAAPASAVQRAADYMNLINYNKEQFCDGFVRLAMSSTADTCIIPLQDYLALGDECRINVPGVVGNSWCVRIGEDEFGKDTEDKIYRITKLYGRLNGKRKAGTNV